MLKLKNSWHAWLRIFFLAMGLFALHPLFSQFNLKFDLKKPKLYENRKLPSELTPDKKISAIKLFKENVFTHYNFYFNSNEKIKKVVASAKLSHIDTFNTLLSFYNYDLNTTAQQQTDLDSVILKTNNGVLLHDLRNDWVDDLYFLMGKSYFFQKKFDSAYDVFQYINYTFQPKDKSERGFEKTIGSNINSKGNVFNISSRESGLMAHKPIRNESLLWIIRTQLEQNNDDDARSMIETLVRDVDFPKRLYPYLFELKSYSFYKAQQYDSAAHYLEGAIPVCINRQERARMYYLIAQLYARSNNPFLANKAFDRAISRTANPVMAAYAKIYQISLASNRNDKNEKIKDNIKSLLKLANKEKYISYRPIIYAAAAEMELSRDSIMRAIEMLVQSNKHNTLDPNLKLTNNLKIALLAFANKKYTLAKIYFDSTSNTQPGYTKEVEIKKSIVTKLADAMSIINKEDSLQMVAAKPEKELESYIKAQLKKLKKDEKLNGTLNNTSVSTNKNYNPNVATNDLFQSQPKSGDWYFNNPTIKSQGSIAFNNKWGNRKNIDNWRRSNSNSSLAKANKNQNDPTGEQSNLDDKNESTEISFNSLLEPLPTTPEKLIQSNSKKAAAITILATLYKEKLEDCGEAIYWNKQLLEIEPDSSKLDQVYANLAFCYKQLNLTEQAKYFTDLLVKKSPQSTLTKQLLNPISLNKKDKSKDIVVEKKYIEIYNQFISGDFAKAIANKKIADSLYGEMYWTPQLLYIESVYYIKERKDSLAMMTLTKIETLAPSSPMAKRAKIVKDLLKNRDSIEMNLRSMNVRRMKEDENTIVVSTETTQNNLVTTENTKIIKKDTTETPIITPKEPIKEESALVKKDTTETPIITPKQPIKEEIALVKKDTMNIDSKNKPNPSLAFQFDPKESYGVIMIMNNVDIIYINEARRSLERYHFEKYNEKIFTMVQNKIGLEPYIYISPFMDAADALAYLEKTKQDAAKVIFPWLPSDKYSFYIISFSNYNKLLDNKDATKYIDFIKNQFPGKF